jgi:hypothetical protein
MLSVFFFLLMFSNESHSQSSVPRPGLYSGNLHLSQSGRKIPFQMSLNFSEDEAPAEAEEILIAKRGLRASFVLDSEAGPYNFSNVSYFIEDGRMDMIYLRSLDGPSSTPRFRLIGNMKGGVFHGRVQTASQGDIGSVTLSLAGGPGTSLTVSPKYGGLYRGTMKIEGDPTTDKIHVLLSPGIGSDQNPPSYDFDFSPRKSGSFQILDGATNLAFTRVNVDYLRGTIEMVHVGGNGELSLRGNLSETVIKGAMASSRRSGTFEVRKDQSP